MQIEYDYWTEKGYRHFGILTKASPFAFVDIGYYKGKRVFGCLNENVTLPKLQSSLAKIVADTRAKEEAAEALKSEQIALAQAKYARQQAEVYRQRREQEEHTRRQATLEKSLRIKLEAFQQLELKLEQDYSGAHAFWREHYSSFLSECDFDECRTGYVKKWSQRYPDLQLDEEQAEAVAEYGPHIQVIARAGSGKTRTLVARALFQITHCRIPASSMLILAFNKKAVEEIRERLSKHLQEEQMPHVLTFHALAYRIVMPDEDLIYDEGETTEGQVFSTTIQRIIDEWMRGGSFESKLRTLMVARWDSDLGRIIALGFNLPQEEFLAHRTNLYRTTMDGRRVGSEAHKHIGNALLRLRTRYSYRRGIHRYAGEAYSPDFSHYNKETEHRFLIEVLDEEAAQANPARQAFWNSDRSANAHLLQLNAGDCQDPAVTLERVAKELASHGFSASPMSDDELWLTLRDDVIRDFTKAVRGFVSRCQKELISPDRLDGMLPDTDPDLWKYEWIGGKLIRVLNVWGLQVRFWRLCSAIYRRYREVLTESHQTDFDQLMLDAAGMLREGRTGFKSARGGGDISQIKHLLIDEFQDFSHLFDELRKSIVNQSPEANFFCVGDDWQAINKFAGSDLRYFTGFRETFKPSVRKLITRNYRSCRKIVEIGNRVMDGHGEPSIPNSTEQGNIWRVEVGGLLNLTEAEEIVLDELGDDALTILRIASDCTSRSETVAILSRTNSVATSERMTKLEKWQGALRRYLPEKDRELLEVSTTHGFKGKEADVVILLAPEAYPFAHPDAIFATIFGDTFQSIENDEKRLFYVGVTRPKKTLFLLSYPSQYSATRQYRIKFLEGASLEYFDINRLHSNLLCGSRVVVRLSNQRGSSKSSGTYPIKDRLKGAGYKWSEESNSWWRFLEEGSISSPFECRQFLQNQPWIPDADGILASFAWEDQQHRMVIVEGRVTPDGISGQMPAEPRPVDKPHPAPVPKKIESNLKPRQHQPIEPKQRIHPPVPPPMGVPSGVFETSIVGMKYDGRMEKARHLSNGDFVRLEREAGNTHDRNAIKVVTTEGVHIGYLSRQVSAHLAEGLDAWGGFSQAKVTTVWTQPPPHFHLSIQICFPLPPGVSIPQELDEKAELENSPFDSPRPKPREHKLPEIVETAPIVTSVPTPTEPEPIAPPASTSDSHLSDHETPPSHYESLSPSQREDLENLLEPRLAPLIAEMYLAGCSDWPEIGYEGRDSDGRCTGTMLEVAWLDFKIGIAIPANDFRSFAQAGWSIVQAATTTAPELQSLFAAKSESTAPAAAIPPSQTNPAAPDIGEMPPNKDYTDSNIHHQYGQFYDDVPDDDIPY